LVPLALSLLRDYEETHTDGSNAFIYSRFLVPHLMGFKDWAIFCDGDMLVRDDICKLWDMRDEQCAVQVVKHAYKTKSPRKYLGTSMETINPDYPRKNWSSVILWNCGHPANRILTPGYVMAATGSKLHRFEHLTEDEIGDLPKEWNHLAIESAPDPAAKLVHYTLGVPGILAYSDCEHADEWLRTRDEIGRVEI
jgi:lipopolysaccharide biosynthesis glycosyltransferase